MKKTRKSKQKKTENRLWIFIRQRFYELLGATLILIGLGMTALILLYNPDDFSFSTQQTGPTQQSLYTIFGYTMDVGIQGFGMAIAFLVLLTLAWGWRFLSHQGVSLVFIRLALAPLCLIGLSMGLYLIPVSMPWPLLVNWGGAFGALTFDKLFALSSGYITFMSPYILPIGLSVLSFIVGLFVIGLNGREWRWVGHFITQSFVRLWRGLIWLGQKIWLVASKYIFRSGGTLDQKTRKAKLLPFGRRNKQEAVIASSKRVRATAPASSLESTARILDHEEANYDEDEPLPGTLPARLETASSRSTTVRSKEKLIHEPLKLVPNTNFRLPHLNLLAKPDKHKKEKPIDRDVLQENARELEAVLNDFGVNGRIVNVRPGPIVTLYELEPAPGVKTSRIINLSDDIARSMRAISVRSAVIPGQNVIGIELPNQKRDKVILQEILDTPAYEQTASTLALALGKDIGGRPVVVDLGRMPHLLMAGTTGSGKSVAINVLILSLLYRLTPDQCRFIMIDPKMLELSVYDGIPHLLAPVVTDPKKAIVALKWVVREMERRYQAMARLGVRNIIGYNQKLLKAKEKGEVLSRKVQTGYDIETGEAIYEEVVIDTTPLPYIVVIADEIADLMMVAGKEIEAAIQRLAQMARASGIHLILATQRPSVDVITGTIKANFPCRISFQVTSKIDSRTILGEQGAEQLLGSGDMLYMAPGGRITRVHGPFVGDSEVEKIVSFLKKQGKPTYVDEVTESDDDANVTDLFGNGGEDARDELYDKAVALVASEGKASTSFIQRHLKIGYNRAATLIERMEKEGVVSKANHVGKRDVLIGSR